MTVPVPLPGTPPVGGFRFSGDINVATILTMLVSLAGVIALSVRMQADIQTNAKDILALRADVAALEVFRDEARVADTENRVALTQILTELQGEVRRLQDVTQALQEERVQPTAHPGIGPPPGLDP